MRASSFGSTRNRRSDAVRDPLSATIIGWNSCRRPRRAASRACSTARSGTENARFFGHHLAEHDVQERDEQQRDDERDRADRPASGQPVSPSGTSSRWWIAGSETFRISSEQIVMPSWLGREHERRVLHRLERGLRARASPLSASGSICERRAEMTANSAPTKNALTSEQHDEPGDSRPVAHRRSPPSVGASSAGIGAA